MRSLIAQQDQLSELEMRLNDCDDAETVQLGLSSRRQDTNHQRKYLLEQIQMQLQTYGKQHMS